MPERHSHWVHSVLTFILTIVAASALLPLLRTQPTFVHSLLNGLNDWVRIVCVFCLCSFFTAIMWRLLSPKARHLDHWQHYPPAWLACMLGWVVVVIIDLFHGFDTDGYDATILEWIAFGGGSLALVGWHKGFWSDVKTYLATKWASSSNIPTSCAAPQAVTIRDLANASWEHIETWMSSDGPADHDLIGHQSIAHRISLLISDGTRSIGMIGPFGAGKTSIVQWVKDRLRRHEVAGRRYFVCHHSCWGFETSSSAIYEMLSSAVALLRDEVDTFQIDSLPETYRKTFSAGGDWVQSISDLLFQHPEPMEQFCHVSRILEKINGRLVIIVEDLDRSDTKHFEIQEVLAFLERLKEFKNFSFVLTGGLTSADQIDFAKLCDHIEFLSSIQPRQSSALIAKVRDRCLDPQAFPQFFVEEPGSTYDWNPVSEHLMRDMEEFTFPAAVATLLNTPRSLRHTLWHTYSVWRFLYGEIRFEDLLGLNVLRFGAPECFQFLLKRWNRLRSAPNQRPTFGLENIEGIREAVLADWKLIIQDVEWSPAAALKVMESILPASQCWLLAKSNSGSTRNDGQSVTEERYWLRAINGAIDNGDIRDQEILRDINEWLANPRTESTLVTKLTSNAVYCDTWENLAGSVFANRRDMILTLCEHVILRILIDQGSAACHDSLGFVHTWRFANRRVADQGNNRIWLQDQISKAAKVSIEMVNGLWHYYGNPGQYSILRIEDGEPVRRHLYEEIKRNLPDSRELCVRLSPMHSATLYQLVFDPGTDRTEILTGVPSWSWLGPLILDALKKRDVNVIANCGVLLGARVSGRQQFAVDTEVLDDFFGSCGTEVIDILDSMSDQIPESDQLLVRHVVAAARRHLGGDVSATGQIDKDDVG